MVQRNNRRLYRAYLLKETLLAVLEAPVDRRVTDYFEETSVPEGFGRNIVNVILVDFRALDTFGEIAVVVIAGVAVLSLLAFSDGRPERRGRQAEEGR